MLTFYGESPSCNKSLDVIYSDESATMSSIRDHKLSQTPPPETSENARNREEGQETRSESVSQLPTSASSSQNNLEASNLSSPKISFAPFTLPTYSEWALMYRTVLSHRIVALDCEMVGVGPGGQKSVLARVSIVDFYGARLLDAFVRVEERVTDYRTSVSGVRPEDLNSPNAIDFGDCRRLVQKILVHKVLVGHALQNDLAVLRVNHPWYNIRDTSIFEPFMRIDRFGNYRPRRLRDLAWNHLGICIQQEGQAHDSLQDACAAMALYKLVQSEWDSLIEFRRRNFVLRAPLRSIQQM